MASIRYYQSRVFSEAIAALSVERRRLLFIGLDRILAIHGAELQGTKWLKYLGDELWELRLGPTVTNVLSMASVDSRPNVIDSDLLLRVFVVFSDSGSVFALHVFDKTENRLRSQQKFAIDQAKELLVLLHNKIRMSS